MEQDLTDRKDSEMQTTESVLKVYEQRGKEGKPLTRVYRQLFNPELFETAYSKIYANLGATTRGTSKDTLDGMSKKRMTTIIEELKREKYRWNPVRRTNIPKADGKTRPLGIPSGNDKLLQAAMKTLLEAYYEPTFSNRSHGFRPGRGCQSALIQVKQKHRDVSWFIEGDIKGCFDNIDHEKLLEIMGERIEDGRLLRLIKYLLKAGYMENWKVYDTYSGTPQGGIISPLLTNIYMDVFDKWVENELLPRYNRRWTTRTGQKTEGRRKNSYHTKLCKMRRKAREEGDKEAEKELGRQIRNTPSVIVKDEHYRKLEYVRYADDFLLSFSGPKEEAKEIKEEIRKFLREELKLELSEEKTLITHARTEKAKFLGYELRVMRSQEKRSVNGTIWYGVPREAIERSCKNYMKGGKSVHRAEMLNNSDYDIIRTYQAEYEGFVQYYIMAHNVIKVSKLKWIAETSLLKTLAHKHKTSVTKTAKKYAGTEKVRGKKYKVIEVKVESKKGKTLRAHFGAVPLVRNSLPSHMKDNNERPNFTNRSELIQRMNANECEMCGKKTELEIHHVRKLKNLTKPGRKTKPRWVERMAILRRKTLAVCWDCHKAIDNGKHRTEWDAWKAKLESRVQ